jgi:hypothetical protein
MVLVPKSYTLPLKCARKYPIHDLFLFIIRVVILELVRWKLRHLNRRRDCYPTQNWLDTLQNASMCLASAKLVATKKKTSQVQSAVFLFKTCNVRGNLFEIFWNCVEDHVKPKPNFCSQHSREFCFPPCNLDDMLYVLTHSEVQNSTPCIWFKFVCSQNSAVHLENLFILQQ